MFSYLFDKSKNRLTTEPNTLNNFVSINEKSFFQIFNDFLFIKFEKYDWTNPKKIKKTYLVHNFDKNLLHLVQNKDTIKINSTDVSKNEKLIIEKYVKKSVNLDEYQYNELLFDANDELLLLIDTILYFSDKKFLYEITINKEKIKIITTKWTDAPNNIIRTTQEGYQKKGFIYILNPKTNEYSLQYKIIYNKGLFCWRNDNHWYLINSSDF